RLHVLQVVATRDPASAQFSGSANETPSSTMPNGFGYESSPNARLRFTPSHFTGSKRTPPTAAKMKMGTFGQTGLPLSSCEHVWGNPAKSPPKNGRTT